MPCLPSKESDQTGHLPTLSLHCIPEDTVIPSLHIEHTVKTDQSYNINCLMQYFEADSKF